MTDSLLFFTFSPVQSFIAEARRAADLYTGSQVLVQLAKAAAESIGKELLIYPALDEHGDLPEDIPNKLVAKVPFDECGKIADDARKALLKCWREKITKDARNAFETQVKIPFDPSIWERQTADGYLWEIYWSASKLDGRDYKDVYDEAERGLVAAKFTRPFAQHPEPGFKDTLSGKRESLHSTEEDGRQYWYRVGQVEAITPIKIRPSVGENADTGRPRERLDAIGVVKRFHPALSEKSLPPFNGFPSTSSIASLDYLEKMRSDIADYKNALAKLFGRREPLMQVRRSDPDFPYDGDFLYKETLTPKRLRDDYQMSQKDIDEYLEDKEQGGKKIEGVKTKLRKLQAIHKPSPYYAIIILDGDGMGEYLRTLDEDGHKKFSASLYHFSQQVTSIASKHHARVIYSGGDDVLAFAPLSTAFAFARELAQVFEQETECTASAGIAISHHLSPLGTALRAARKAESQAKGLDGKKAICIFALKRSGEPIHVRSKWDEAVPFEQVVQHFLMDEISSRLPYDVARSAYALPAADDKFKAELGRLVKRHWQKKADDNDEKKDASARSLSGILQQWAFSFPQADPSQTEELANWLALARFIAKGGRE